MEVTQRGDSSSVGGEPKSKWLVDAKRFNAQQLRRRMKEQKQRFGAKNAKGDDDDDESSNKEEDQSPSNAARPQLTIAISMSEEAEEASPSRTPRDYSPFANLVPLDADSDDLANASAWAMMEHYQIGSSPRGHLIVADGSAEYPLIRDSSFAWDKSFAPEQESLQLSPESKDDASQATPSTITRATQQVIATTENVDHTKGARSSFMNKNKDVRNSDVESESSLVVLWKPDGSKVDPRHTPARLKEHWNEAKRRGDAESPPMSLLQESLIMSEGAANSSTLPSFHTVPSETESVEESVDENNDQSSHQAIVPVDDASRTQLSKVSFQGSTDSAMALSEIVNSSRVEELLQGPFSHMPLTDITPFMNNRSDFAHLEKIVQLEQNLKEQKDNTNQMQLKLQERVVELEQALRASAATPRGTILQENPLKTLLDRNQTLVKEVRFADSTCVELSAKVSALEAQKEILQKQVATLEVENKDLRRDYEQVIKSDSASRNEEAMKFSFSSIGFAQTFVDEDGILRQAMGDLKAELAGMPRESADPYVSVATTLLSDIDTSLDKVADESPDLPDKSFTSQCLAKALQAQVRLLKEQKKMTEESQALAAQLKAAQSRNDKLDLELERQHAKKDTDVPDANLALDLSRAQEENDFLGRQLGRVQEQLDQTRQALEQEKKNFACNDSRWRKETKGHLCKIRMLEDKLEKASQSLTAPSSDGESGINSPRALGIHVMNAEQEILNVKSCLMSFKEDMELLLSKEQYFLTHNSSARHESEVANVVAIFVQKMRRNFAILNAKVDLVVENNCSRLENLTQTVAFLRSSLMFEEESISTAEAPTSPAGPIRRQGSVWQTDDGDVVDDDDVYSRMEEARGSPSRQNDPSDDMSSDWDDFLLSDDSTLESILRTATSEKSGGWEYETWKKPLEAAIRECQRVRSRSVALKEELRSEKIAFAQLETENRRLVLECSQKEEEKKLVEDALDEAKSQIQQLHSDIEDVLDKKEQAEHIRSEIQRRCDRLEDEKLSLEALLKKSESDKAAAEDRLSSLSLEVKEAQEQLQAAHVSIEDREKDLTYLKRRLEEVEGRASEAEDMLLESRCVQEDMRKERAELKLQLGKSENEVQSLKENYGKEIGKSQEQVQAMHAVIETLHLQHEESQRNLQRFSSFYHDIVDLFERSEIVSFSRPQDQPHSRKNVDWSLLGQIVPFVSSILNDVNGRDEEISVLRKDILRLQGDFKRATDLGTEYQKQVEDGKTQNEKLFELVRQAELEMERSANQIREMSNALSKLQKQESDLLVKARSAQEETDSVRDDLLKVQHDLSSERKRASQTEKELSQELSAKQKLEEELRSTIDTLESKCSKLREYVKKLTIKCEEWEHSYERQGKLVEKLQAKNSRMREKAMEIGARYKQLSGHVKSKSRVHSEVKEKWAGERNDLQRIHAQLEKELETITYELSTLEQK